MKTFILLMTFLVVLLSCQKEQDEGYITEFLQFKQAIEQQILVVDKNITDSAMIIIDNYLEGIKPMSCLYCVAEGEIFAPVSAYCERHPESLIFVLESAVKGSRLTFGFRKLFKEFYPEKFSELLESEEIVLIPGPEVKTEEDIWENKVKENSLPFKLLTEEYLKIVAN
ncbi:MAG: hypothetical protein ACP5D9_11760 [Mariniphaga sp.]